MKNHIPATVSMAKLYQSQGYYLESEKLYARMGRGADGAKLLEGQEPAVSQKTPLKKKPAISLRPSITSQIDQWVCLLLLQRQTDSWKDANKENPREKELPKT